MRLASISHDQIVQIEMNVTYSQRYVMLTTHTTQNLEIIVRTNVKGCCVVCWEIPLLLLLL